MGSGCERRKLPLRVRGGLSQSGLQVQGERNMTTPRLLLCDPSETMAKNARTQFLCNSCGSVHPKWLGKCPDCGTWDSLEEYKTPLPRRTHGPRADRREARRVISPAGPRRRRRCMRLTNRTPHLPGPTGIGEFDRILGGGVVPGSGHSSSAESRGLGKSTLLLPGELTPSVVLRGKRHEWW